ncbi:hypothetical protein BT96DRAFT_989548 [Gymnopus androsaceus JB14]|uniref:Uncharacterized protein n=1 Tax=Gymnopus androsaceus JB14 TaxID=1447944 RepID=A0A6A4I649_9AGAR|nr:hypothetical protein BT96DRAFT_989548 [Gymnopus androsaceus JB14]
MFCTNVIPFGPSSPTWVQVKDKEWEMTLPVSSIRVPDPPTFHLVLQYCYLRSQDMFFSVFIPDLYLFWTRPRSSLPTVYTNFMANCTSEDAIRALAVYLGTMFEPWKLFKYAQIVHRVWLNVCALGVFDEILWKVIEGCYQVLQRASWRPESTRPPLAAVNM